MARAKIDLTKVPAGTVIDASNLAKYGDIGGPSIRWLVEHGVKLNVGRYRKVSNPRPFREATEKYSAKVQLSADGTHLVDHVAGLPFPNIDHAHQDDTWLYLPQLRRVRRLSVPQRSDALFDQDIDMNSFGGFAGKISQYDWKYLGEKTILATFHDATIPIEWGAAPGDYVHVASWEPRKVWVVEGVPKYPENVYPTTILRSDAHSRRVLYIDQESFRIPYSDIYDLSAQLSKVWINSFLFAKGPTADSKYQADYEVPYEPSITMVDMQKQHATFCELPSRRFPGEQGWYVNVGDKEGTIEAQFDPTHPMGERQDIGIAQKSRPRALSVIRLRSCWPACCSRRIRFPG